MTTLGPEQESAEPFRLLDVNVREAVMASGPTSAGWYRTWRGRRFGRGLHISTKTALYDTSLAPTTTNR